MFKNGRPVTVMQSGFVDDELITDPCYAPDIEKIRKWIDENVLTGYTSKAPLNSYGLKHCMEYDIGVYTTNNAFKDAMFMFAGVLPIDPNDQNWEYKIRLKNRPKREDYFQRRTS